MRKILVLVCVLALLGSAAALVGCGGGGSSSQTPEQVMQAFWTSMVKQDFNTGWNLMSAESQKEVGSKSKFAAGLAAAFKQEVTGGAKFTYGKTTINGNKGTVNVTVSNGGNIHTTSMPVIKENGVWKVDMVQFVNQIQ